MIEVMIGDNINRTNIDGAVDKLLEGFEGVTFIRALYPQEHNTRVLLETQSEEQGWAIYDRATDIWG